MTHTLHKTITFPSHSQDRLFQGVRRGEGFVSTIDFSVPYIVMAVHAGIQIRDELAPYLLISDSDRRFEEDTATDLIIQGNRSTIWGMDSRAEYDLNRSRDRAVPIRPEYFWGKTVYDDRLPDEMVSKSLKKYDDFYSFLFHCLTLLVQRFGFCVVYDIHSYNISRQQERGFANPPMFNLGTSAQGGGAWRPFIDAWLECLEEIQIDGVNTVVAENEVFRGEKGLSRQVANTMENVLVLPTEISKFYMDEHNGVLNTSMVIALQRELLKTIVNHHSQYDSLLQPPGRTSVAKQR